MLSVKLLVSADISDSSLNTVIALVEAKRVK